MKLFLTEPQEEFLRRDLLIDMENRDYNSWFYAMSIWGFQNGEVWRVK